MAIEISEGKENTLLCKGEDGAVETLYPNFQFWVNAQNLKVGMSLEVDGKTGGPPKFKAFISGMAAILGSFSVFGESKSITRTIDLYIGESEVNGESLPSQSGQVLSDSLGVAQLGFNRADWEFSSNDTWYLSCYVPVGTLAPVIQSIERGDLKDLKLGLQMTGVYTDEHPFSPFNRYMSLFLRPAKSGKPQDLPECAHGNITQLDFSLSQVHLTPIPEPEVFVDEDPEPTPEPAPPPPDPVAVSIKALTANLEALRKTVKWVGCIIAIVLFMLAIK